MLPSRAAQTLVVLSVLACNQAPPPTPPVAIVVPAATSMPAAPAASVPAPPCTPHAWASIAEPPTDPSFGTPDPSPSALAAATPALKATCKRLELVNKQHAMAAFPSEPGMFGADAKKAVQYSTGYGCFAGAKGAWILETGIFRKEKNGVGLEAPWRLLYLTSDARPLANKDASGDTWEADGEGRLGPLIDGVHDFDGDGIDEVGVSVVGYASIDGPHHDGPTLYRVQDGAVVAWDPVPGRHVVGSTDADRDGRADLVLFAAPSWFELAHATADGKFELDDEVTRAFLHAQCIRPRSPAPSLPPMAAPAVMPGMPAQASEEQVDKLCAGVRAIEAECPAKR